ncbi:MAG: alginate export family protein [Gemmatimonadetes bacterium]|nr:alginate export family protein [Gemmatimonadota bacterium]
MKKLTVVLAAALLLPAAASGQDTSLGGQLRIRYEARDPFAGPTGDLETFISMRARADLLAELSSDVSVFLQIQDVRLWGEETSTLGDFNADNFDLHQGYIQFEEDGSWFRGRVGRQEVDFGGQRLVGAVGWTQQGRSFDGVRLEGAGDFGRVRVLAAQLGNSLAADVDRDAELLAGYGTFDVADDHAVDVYVIVNHTDAADGPADDGTDQVTLGGRWVGETDGFRYRAEGSIQTGSRAGTDVSAFMLGGRVGKQFGNATVTLWYDYLSGDDDPLDDEIKVFDTLFATNHKFYGLADLFLNIPAHTGGQGLQDLAAKLAVRPHDDWRLAADVHSFRLAKTGDLGSAHLGEEIDLTATWMHSANFTIQGGLSFVFQDDAWADIGRLDEDMVWTYVMLDARF